MDVEEGINKNIPDHQQIKNMFRIGISKLPLITFYLSNLEFHLVHQKRKKFFM
jgi:hypothetical protein